MAPEEGCGVSPGPSAAGSRGVERARGQQGARAAWAGAGCAAAAAESEPRLPRLQQREVSPEANLHLAPRSPGARMLRVLLLIPPRRYRPPQPFPVPVV